jgi:hypothetical protein
LLKDLRRRSKQKVVEPLNRVHLGKSAGAAQPSRNRVFGCKNMYIGDSLVIAASLA